MGQFSDWLRRGKNYREGENVEFYEDTHDDKGEYRKTPGFPPSLSPLPHTTDPDPAKKSHCERMT